MASTVPGFDDGTTNLYLAHLVAVSIEFANLAENSKVPHFLGQTLRKKESLECVWGSLSLVARSVAICAGRVPKFWGAATSVVSVGCASAIEWFPRLQCMTFFGVNYDNAQSLVARRDFVALLRRSTFPEKCFARAHSFSYRNYYMS